jgi:hypothetical protein
MFEKGKPKTGGRKPGTPNKSTGELRDQLQQLIETTLTDLPDLLAVVEPAERIRLLTALLPYVMPKLSAVDLTATTPSLENGSEIQIWTSERLNAFNTWYDNHADEYPLNPDASTQPLN